MSTLRGLLIGAVVLVILAGCRADPATSTKEQEASPTTSAFDYYEEPLRPRLHFTPEQGWMNDPNGLVFADGRYHLFYQYHPNSTVWGPMHWGHAYSKDLVHWEHLPVALEPDELGTIFSGSVVLDEANTSGFGSLENPALVALFTYHNHAGEDAGRNDFQTQGLAYSTNGGITWTKYSNNPVLPNPGLKDFRDPKVTWHAPSEQWVMALAALDRVKFYTSPDLKTWTFASEFGGEGVGSQTGIWECPDLFPMREYISSDLRYVLIVSVQDGAPAGGTGTSYFVGEFDGKTFTAAEGAQEPLWLDYGADNYAFVTFSNSPTPENRKLGIGWMSNWQYAQQVPEQGWRSAMTLPRSLTLRRTADGVRLKQEIVPDYFALRGRRLKLSRLSNLVPTNLSQTVTEWGQGAIDINIDVPDGALPDFSLVVTSTVGDTLSFGYDKASDSYFIDRTGLRNTGFSESYAALHTAVRKTSITSTGVRIILDRTSVELLGDDGFTVLTDNYFMEGERQHVQLHGEANITGTIYELQEAIPTPLSVARIKLGLD